MSERGILRIVVEGDDAQLFHDGLLRLTAEWLDTIEVIN